MTTSVKTSTRNVLKCRSSCCGKAGLYYTVNSFQCVPVKTYRMSLFILFKKWRMKSNPQKIQVVPSWHYSHCLAEVSCTASTPKWRWTTREGRCANRAVDLNKQHVLEVLRIPSPILTRRPRRKHEHPSSILIRRV